MTTKKNPNENHWWIFYLITLITMLALCSCRSQRSAEHVYHEKVRNVTAADSVRHDHDSASSTTSVLTSHSADTLRAQAIIRDSVFVEQSTETVITKTVDVDGNVIGTDKVTTVNRNREHFRDSNATADASHSRIADSVQTSEVNDVTADAQNQVIVYEGFDSLYNRSIAKADAEKQSWIERLAQRIGSIALALLAVIGSSFVVYLIFRLYVKK